MTIRRTLTILLLLTVCLPLAAAGEERPTPRTYALKFRDGHTVGTWILVLDNGIQREVTLTDDSNMVAAKALNDLHPEIVRLNTISEHLLYLVGHLDISNPAATGALGSGEAPFRLDGWYIKAPFYLPPSKDPEGPIEVASSLLPKHFLPGGEREDSEGTRKVREAIKIHYYPRLNSYGIGAQPPVIRFLSKTSE